MKKYENTSSDPSVSADQKNVAASERKTAQDLRDSQERDINAKNSK